MLTLDQLHVAVAAANQQFKLILKKYPDFQKYDNLWPYLVMSSPRGQTGINSVPLEILREFPAMVVNDSAKTNALNLMARLKDLVGKGQIGTETEQLMAQLAKNALLLKFDETCQVEIRFKELNYDLIWQLQVDELVDRTLTLQRKASIRIVLGTLARFVSDQKTDEQ